MRAANVVRSAWGLALVLFPTSMLRLMRGAPIDRRWRTVARILGVRHLVQAWVAGGHDTHRIAIAGIDAVHATTAFGFAACSRRYRRVGCLDGAIATMFALSTVAGARDDPTLTASSPTGDPQGSRLPRIRARARVLKLTCPCPGAEVFSA